MSEILHNIGRFLSYDPSAPMLFSSGTFWALFLVFMPLYGLLRRRLWQMVVFVVAFSFFFYYKSSGWFVLMLAGTSLVDWWLSHLMSHPGRSSAFRRGCVAVSLILSLGILAYFKYANFFLWNINAMVGGNFQPLELVLPVGISFYTFQSVSYIIDVYKGRVAPTATWLEYAFFLSFFPALVAGPIVRADYFLPQIRENRHATRTEVYTGLWLIILGVVKKAIIADYIAQYNDLIFQTPGGYSGFETLMGIIGYTMQIYCDFSGYSDMAIGIALIMGFKLAKNFNFPYKAQNLTDFWRRWHISLSTWFKEYVYIPLGGNRAGRGRAHLNILIVWVLTGFWHGASFNFLAWGLYYALLLMLEKDVLAKLLNKLPKAVGTVYTLFFVLIGWVLFASDSLTESIGYLKLMFGFSGAGAVSPMFFYDVLSNMVLLVIAAAASLPFGAKIGRRFVQKSPAAAVIPVAVALILCTAYLVDAGYNPFLYFRF